MRSGTGIHLAALVLSGLACAMAGEAGGLRLDLRLEAVEVDEGDPLRGSLRVANLGSERMRLPPGRAELVLRDAAGRPVAPAARMGAGGKVQRPPQDVAAGGELPVLDLAGAQPGPLTELHASGLDGGFVAYRLDAGVYRISSRYERDGGQAGSDALVSSETEVRVRPRRVSVPVVDGLEMLLAGTCDHLEVRVRNAGSAPLVIDLGGMAVAEGEEPGQPQRWQLIAHDPDGARPPSRVACRLAEQPAPGSSRFRELPPGAAMWLPYRFAATVPGAALAAGTWIVAAHYDNPADGVGQGPPHRVLAGHFVSNAVRIEVGGF